MKKTTLLYIIIGSILVVLTCFAAFFMVTIESDIQILCLKVILGIGASAFMVALPGAINFDLPKGIHASGVFSIFCIIFFFGIPSKSSIVMYSVVGNLRFIDTDSTEIASPFEGITFSITPPKTGVENTGYFHIENIPVDENDETNPVILTINKKGYSSLGITVDEDLPAKLKKFEIQRVGNRFDINPNDFVYLKKNRNDCYWGHSLTPAYSSIRAHVADTVIP
ncbi:MAG: hypothetical protein WCX31_05755 [Salinivirgaceae bacterium]|jgi:hypothetical protein